MNTNVSENSEITVETSRAINSEISSQMSRKLEEMRSDLNSHILNAIDSAIEEKVIPSIRNALESQNSTKNTNTDLRSAGPHPSTFGQVRPQRDLRSVRPQQQIAGKASQDAKKDILRLVTMSSNQINHQREDSVIFCGSDDENGYDMVTGDNLTPQMVTEFLTGRPMQSQNKIPHQQCVCRYLVGGLREITFGLSELCVGSGEDLPAWGNKVNCLLSLDFSTEVVCISYSFRLVSSAPNFREIYLPQLSSDPLLLKAYPGAGGDSFCAGAEVTHGPLTVASVSGIVISTSVVFSTDSDSMDGCSFRTSGLGGSPGTSSRVFGSAALVLVSLSSFAS